MKIGILAFILTIAFSSVVRAQTPTGIIFDTDMGNDVDDALALAMLHAFQDRHEVNLLAVTITKDNKFAAPYVDLVNTFYGHPEIPIGTVRNGKTPESNPMIQIPSERRRANGTLRLSSPDFGWRPGAGCSRTAPPDAGEAEGRERRDRAGRFQHQPGPLAGDEVRRGQFG